MSFKFSHLEKIVGVFLIIVILVIVTVVVLIGRERRWFEKHYYFTTKFLRGEGLSPGMQVTIKGIQIGEVKTVFLNEDNWIEVKFSVYEEYAPRIRKDSVAQIKSPLLGSKTVEIIPGDRTMPTLANGSFIWSSDTDQGKGIIEKKQKVEAPDQIARIMDNVEKLTYNLSAQNGALTQSLEKIKSFFDMISSKEGSLNKSLESLENIMASIEDKNNSIGKILNDNYELYNHVITMLKDLSDTIENFKQLSKSLSDSSPEIKAAIERSNQTMNEAIGLMKTLKENFLIKGFSSYKEQKAPPIEGIEREGEYSGSENR